LFLGDGERLAFDEVVWVTGAAAPAWPRASGLQTDGAGFIAVDAHLQSLSHPGVFAAGDIASMLDTPRPKSGVYAVRQGPPLAENLRRALRGEPLVTYHPQPRALALISAGDRYAVASYGPFTLSGAWVWRWKDRIDSAFMQRYRIAPENQ
jgi:selenide, water dikinase